MITTQSLQLAQRLVHQTEARGGAGAQGAAYHDLANVYRHLHDMDSAMMVCAIYVILQNVQNPYFALYHYY